MEGVGLQRQRPRFAGGAANPSSGATLIAGDGPNHGATAVASDSSNRETTPLHGAAAVAGDASAAPSPVGGTVPASIGSPGGSRVECTEVARSQRLNAHFYFGLACYVVWS